MKKYLVILGVLSLAACGTKKNSETTNVASSEIPLPDGQEKKKAVRPIYNPSETRENDILHTKLEVSFDWDNQRMNGKATIDVKPHFYAQKKLVLDAKGMDIHAVKLKDKDGMKLTHHYDEQFLSIDLDKTYERTDTFTVYIEYTAKPEERTAGGSQAIMSDKGLYFINPKGEDPNKVKQIWTQGETEASSVWFPTIDAPNEKMTQEIQMTVKDEFKTLSNGKMIFSSENGDGTRTDVWRQDIPHAPYLTMMFVGDFAVVKDTLVKSDGSILEVDYYVEKEWEKYAKDIFGATPEMIKFFGERLGYEYPWDKYSQVVVRDYVSGAMENTTAVIHGDFLYQTKRDLIDSDNESIIAHELFHHWFGDLVTCESWANLPLNESFANYSQFLWDEYKYGENHADYYSEIEEEGYYQSAEYSGLHDMIWFAYKDKEQMFDGHSYNKGGRILHMLRNHVGDDAFFASLKLYLTRNEFKPAEIHQLRLAFEEVTGEDLNWFFNQWFFGKGHPELKVEYQIDSMENALVVSIEQMQNFDEVPLYKLPFKIKVFSGEKENEYDVTIQEQFTVLQFPLLGELKNVLFDSEKILLAKIKEEKPASFYYHQYYHSDEYKERKEAILEASKSKSKEAVELIFKAMEDPFWALRSLAVVKSRKAQTEDSGRMFEALMKRVREDDNSLVRTQALAKLIKYYKEKEEVVVLIKELIEKEKSYSVLGKALNGLIEMNPKEGMAMAKKMENEESQDLILAISAIYAEHGKAEQYDFYEKAWKEIGGFKKIGLASNFTAYVVNQNNDVVEKALAIYENMAQSGNMYMQVFLPNLLGQVTNKLDNEATSINAEIEQLRKDGKGEQATQKENDILKIETIKKRIDEILGSLDKKDNMKVIIRNAGEDE
ncbi:MAG: M1 family metallopeptidase [Crocinitomicaceae bacterium]|nr:M1 family metallopeptidase [Crocinitomicaceae bacterium]